MNPRERLLLAVGLNRSRGNGRQPTAPGEVGELVLRAPSIGLTRGVWGDPERYMETYWSHYPGIWRHGDWARPNPDAATWSRPTKELDFRSKGRINALFSLFHQEKKDIDDAVQPWGIRYLTDFRRHAQYCSLPLVNPAKFQSPGMPTTCRGSCKLTQARGSH